MPGRSERWFPRRVFLELEAATSLRALQANSAPAEWHLGATFCATRALAIEGGGGGALGHGIGAPAARLLLGVSWSPSACAGPAQATAGELVTPPAPAPQPEPVAPLIAAPAKVEPPPAPPAAEPPKVEPAPAAPEQVAPPKHDEPPLPALPALPDVPAEHKPAPPPLPELPLIAKADDEARALVHLDDHAIEIREQVRFKTGKAAIDRRSNKLLDALAALLSEHPEIELVEVQGHTDNVGGAKKNKQLSQARAQAVVKALVARGVEAARLRAKGYGDEVPLAPNINAKNREKNRRVELKVINRSGEKKSGA
jgi:outer membrane protein OmpA-like peptidoglycan-associated protein